MFVLLPHLSLLTRVVGAVALGGLEAVLLHLVAVEHARLGGLVAADVAGVADTFMLGSFVQLGIEGRSADILALVTLERLARVFGLLVSVKATELGELGGAEFAVVQLAVPYYGLADPFMLGLLVPYQTAFLRGDILALITRVLLLNRRLRLNTAWLTARVVDLIEAVPRRLLVHLLVLHLDWHLHRLVLCLRRGLQVQGLVVVQPPGVGPDVVALKLGVGAGAVGQVLWDVLPGRHHEVGREVRHLGARRVSEQGGDQRTF